MLNNRREAPLELEIQSLLILHGSATSAASALLSKYENQGLALAQIEAIAIFCLHAGLPVSLLDFLCKQLQLDSKIPWAHFAEALSLSQKRKNEKVYQALLDGAQAQALTSHLARSHALDSFDPKMVHERAQRKTKLQEKALEHKNDLLIQVEMLRSQELDEEEGRILDKLLQFFPKDLQIHELYSEHRSRKAMRLLDSRTTQPLDRQWEEHEPELDSDSLKGLAVISHSMHEGWSQQNFDSQLGSDFAVAHWMWENPEGALPFVPVDLGLPSALWLRAEVLLRTRRFVDLLAELAPIETQNSDDPEATFAISYFRAQAFWGLSRPFDAIEILEGILSVRPHYRAAEALLLVWKRGSTS